MNHNYSDCVRKIIISRIKQSGTNKFVPDVNYFRSIQNCKKDASQQNFKKQSMDIKPISVELSFFRKVKLYILAELYTIIKGQINKKQYTQRKTACLDCHGRVDSIEGKIDPGGIGFCSLCGCGASKRAALSVKLTIGGASCPLNKWEPLHGSEWSFKIAIEAILGLCSSVVYHVKKKIYNFIRNLVFRRSI